MQNLMNRSSISMIKTLILLADLTKPLFSWGNMKRDRQFSLMFHFLRDRFMQMSL